MTKVIKAGSGEGPRRAIVDAPLYDAQEEARRLLESAQAEALKTRDEAALQAEHVLAQASAEGRERGLAAVTELLTAARSAAARAHAGAEQDLRVLAVRIAEKLLGRELALSADAITDVVLTTLRHAGQPRALLVRVSPEDLEALERGKPRLLERCRSAEVVTFRADPAVGRGGCVLETELGVVDARLATQLEAIERALRAGSG